VFPCLDELTFKATFNITIKHFPFYRALSNMPIKNTEMQKRMILTSFDNTPVISTYAVAITLLLRLIDIPFFDNTTWYFSNVTHLPYIQFSHYLISKVMEHTKSEEWKNLNINTSKYVVSPEYPYESREYFGLIFYRYYTLYIT